MARPLPTKKKTKSGAAITRTNAQHASQRVESDEVLASCWFMTPRSAAKMITKVVAIKSNESESKNL